MEWRWDCRSAGPSLRRMAAGCGQKRMNLAARYFSSPAQRVRRINSEMALRDLASPHELGRYRGKADVASSGHANGFMGKRPR
jgi:hypothetical protein